MKRVMRLESCPFLRLYFGKWSMNNGSCQRFGEVNCWGPSEEEDLATYLPNLYCRRHFGNVGKDDLERNEAGGGGRLLLWVKPEEGPSQAHVSWRHDMRLEISDG